MAIVLVAVGIVLLAVGGLWLLVLAFAQSIVWGLGAFLLWPTVTFAFALTEWPRTAVPLALHLGGLLLALAGAVLWAASRVESLV